MISTLTDTEELEKKRNDLRKKQNDLLEKIEDTVHKCTGLNADLEEFQEQYDKLKNRIDKTKNELQLVDGEIEERKAQTTALKLYVKRLEKQDGMIKEFDKNLWCSLVKEVIVYPDGKMCFVFRDGTKWMVQK